MFEPVNLENGWALYLALLLIPYALLRFFQLRKAGVPSPFLQMTGPGIARRLLAWFPLAGELVMALLLVLALAGPYTEMRTELVSEKGIDVALALDASGSMRAEDFKPNRLEALKKLASEFVSRSSNNRIAVYVFAVNVYTQSPLTTDHAVIHDLIDSIAPEMFVMADDGGTAIGDAILMASDGLSLHRRTGRSQVIILITDGENNMGIDPLKAAVVARDGDIHLSIIGMGGDKPVEVYINGKPYIDEYGRVYKTKLDEEQLKKIAEAAGGNYYRARDVDALAEIFARIARLEATPLDVDSLTMRNSYRPLIALLLLAVFAAHLVATGIFIRRPYR